jgi:hypothetical protein
MSIGTLPRWFTLSDGTYTFKVTLYEAMKYSQSIEPKGGFEVLRMQDGTALKQTNWTKNQITLSGSGGIPIGMGKLNFGLPITLSCGAPEVLKSATNSFALPSHRTDTGYEPVVLKLVEGLWFPLSASGTAEEYACFYYPIFTCFFAPPTRGYAWDEASPATWSLTGEEV